MTLKAYTPSNLPTDNYKEIIDYSQFPFKVWFEGSTSGAEEFHCINMHAFELFGHRHGICYIGENDNELGRCYDASISSDAYEVTEDYLIYHDSFYFCDKNGEYHDINQEIEGPYSQLYDLEHSHVGVYTTKFLGKTGYDFGEKLYYFRKEEDALLFCLLLSNYQPTYLGEKPYVFKKNNQSTVY